MRIPSPREDTNPSSKQDSQMSSDCVAPRQRMSSRPQAPGEEREPSRDHRSRGQSLTPEPCHLPSPYEHGGRGSAISLPPDGQVQGIALPHAAQHPRGSDALRSLPEHGRVPCPQSCRAAESCYPWGAQMRHLCAQSLCLRWLRTDAFVTAQSQVLHGASPSPLRVESPLGCLAGVMELVGLCQLPCAWSQSTPV